MKLSNLRIFVPKQSVEIKKPVRFLFWPMITFLAHLSVWPDEESHKLSGQGRNRQIEKTKNGQKQDEKGGRIQQKSTNLATREKRF